MLQYVLCGWLVRRVEAKDEHTHQVRHLRLEGHHGR